MRRERGFTLLEVLVAMAILGLAVVTLIQLASQGLRLVKLSGDHQQAALLADRLVRETEALVEGVQTGQDGAMTWERHITEVATAEELAPPSGPRPKLLALVVRVHWGGARSLEVATLRAVAPPPSMPSR